jgi:hypothetical protein
VGFRSKRTLRLVLRAAGETETTQEKKKSKIGFRWMKETLEFRF